MADGEDTRPDNRQAMAKAENNQGVPQVRMAHLLHQRPQSDSGLQRELLETIWCRESLRGGGLTPEDMMIEGVYFHDHVEPWA